MRLRSSASVKHRNVKLRRHTHLASCMLVGSTFNPVEALMRKVLILVAGLIASSAPANAQVGVPPVGTVVAFAGPVASIPSGWMVCDGRRMSRNTYPTLFRAIGTTWGGDGAPGFYLPDLQGMFLRGVDKDHDGIPTNPARDPGRDERTAPRAPEPAAGNQQNNVGSVQLDQFQDHAHAISADRTIAGSNNTRDAEGGDEKSNTYPPVTLTIGQPNSGRHGPETRPRNAYVYYIIRVR
jgi:microcystin-dependent protein